jgi:uncharacterized protein
MRNTMLDSRFTYQRLRVGRSSIHRMGVFAAEDIVRGRKIIEYTGERITHREARKRFVKFWRSRKRGKGIYLFYVNKRWVIDGAVGGSGAGYINHACDPNLRARRIRGHIFYFSRKPIRKGEELTVDYRFARNAARVVCHCGSSACRGTINRS